MKRTLLLFSMLLLLMQLSTNASIKNSQLIIAAPADGECNFQPGEIVEVYDPIEKNWFSSKILKAENARWFIHYNGYDSKWDTWATCDRIRRPGESKPTPGTGNSANNSATGSSANTSVPSANLSMPIICPTAAITLNIGDPIIIKSKEGLKTVVTNLDFQEDVNTFRIIAIDGFHNESFNWKDIALDPNFTYTPLPQTPTVSKNEQYNTGDIIETSWIANSLFGEYEIVQGIIISKDGDNYYIFFENANSKSSYYGWRFVDDIRSPGSTKQILLVSQNGDKKSGFDACKAELNSCYGSFSNKWDFIWYYRHDLFNYTLVVGPETMAFSNTDLLKATLQFYECMYNVLKKYPDVGYSGRTISERYDIQYEFLKDYKNYVKKAFDTRIKGLLQSIITDTRNGFYNYELARTDGKKLILEQMKKDCKAYEANYNEVGGAIQYPEAELNVAYDEALKVFMETDLETNDGLVKEGHTYAGKDARVEQLCIADLQSLYPGAKVVKSGCYNNEFLVELNSLGVPVYRTKTVLILFNSSLFRVPVEAQYTIREEYQGNGKYGNASFPRRGSLVYLKQ